MSTAAAVGRCYPVADDRRQTGESIDPDQARPIVPHRRTRQPLPGDDPESECLGDGEASFAVLTSNTARQVFRYGETLAGGYLIVLSDHPIDTSLERLQEAYRTRPGDRLWEEIVRHPGTRDAEAFYRLIDRPRQDWDAGDLFVSDNHPILEYPWLLKYVTPSTPDGVRPAP